MSSNQQPKKQHKSGKQSTAKKVKAVRKAVINQLGGHGSYTRRAPASTHPARGIPRVGGRGGFWSDLWGGVKDVVRFAPEAMSTFKTIAPLLSGMGSYKVNHNTFLNTQSNNESGFPTNQAPSFSPAGVGSDIVFSHREFVADINSSTAFAANTFVLNPGNPVLFPWLSQIASLYEEYQFLGVVVEFKSTSATAVGTTSSAMGSVIIATDYDCEDANYTNKRAMEAAEYACSGQPFQSFIHPIECDPKRNPLPRLYVAPGITTAAQATGDPRFSIHGITTVATVGQQTAGTAIGELWVSYHVRLSRPILENVSGSTTFSQHIWGTTTTAPVVTIQGSSFLGASFSTSLTGSGNTQKLVLSTPTNSPLIGGTYMLALSAVQSAAGAWVAPAAPTLTFQKTAGSNTVFPPIAYSSTLVHNAVSFAGSTTAGTAGTYSGSNIYSGSAIFTLPTNGDGVEVYLPTSTANASAWDVYITPYNASVSVTAPGRQAVSRSEFEEMSARYLRLAAFLESQSSPPLTAQQSAALRLADEKSKQGEADTARGAAALPDPESPGCTDAKETAEYYAIQQADLELAYRRKLGAIPAKR